MPSNRGGGGRNVGAGPGPPLVEADSAEQLVSLRAARIRKVLPAAEQRVEVLRRAVDRAPRTSAQRLVPPGNLSPDARDDGGLHHPSLRLSRVRIQSRMAPETRPRVVEAEGELARSDPRAQKRPESGPPGPRSARPASGQARRDAATADRVLGRPVRRLRRGRRGRPCGTRRRPQRAANPANHQGRALTSRILNAPSRSSCLNSALKTPR